MEMVFRSELWNQVKEVPSWQKPWNEVT